MNEDSVQLDQVVQLVELLYSCKDSNEVIQIQQRLQQIQKSDKGWTIADQLLRVDSTNCKYFGALTYTVNINLHCSKLKGLNTGNEDEDDDNERKNAQLIEQLLFHTISNCSTVLITRKLLSNLAMLYMNFHRLWSNPVASLVISLQNKTPYIAHVKEPLPLLWDPEILKLGLQFSQIIAEEVSRREQPLSSDFYEAVHDNVFPITRGLMFQNSLLLESLDCLNSWIQYIAIAEHQNIQRYDISNSLDSMLDLISASTDPNVSTKAIDVTIEILDTKPALFNKSLKLKLTNMMFSPWSVEYLNTARETEDFDTINNFSRLVTLNLESQMWDFAASLLDDSSLQRFDFLLSLSSFPAKPIDEELLSKDLLEFWSELAELFIQDKDRLCIIYKNDSDKLAKLDLKYFDLFNKVAVVYWEKIRIPIEDADFAHYKTLFLSFRRDVADMFELVYPIVGPAIYENLVNNVNSNLASSDNQISVTDIELSMYLLDTISGTLSEDNIPPEIIKSLSALLASPLLQLLGSNISNEIAHYLVNTMIQFLSGIDFFYKTDAGLSFLATVLEFLFGCVMQSVTFQLQASKLIAKMADACRMSLVAYLPNFEKILVEMINNAQVQGVVRERITNSYLSIIQGTKNPQIQSTNASILLLLVKERVEVLCSSALPLNGDQVDYLLSLLNCVSEVGKGMQLPDDEEDFYTPEEVDRMNLFWSLDPQGVHDIIISIVNKVCIDNSQRVLVESSEVVERCCLILKRGLPETVKGPFKLDPAVIIGFVVAKFHRCQSSGSLPHLFQLLESLIFANYRELSDAMVSELLNIMLLQNLEMINADPDLKESSVSVLSTIVERKPNLILYDASFGNVLKFCLEQMSTNEKFILKLTSKFWTKMLSLKKGDRRDHEFVSGLFINDNLGLMLTQVTVCGLLQTMRSNIDYFTDVLKLLVAKYQLQLKTWLENAFSYIAQERSRQGQKPLEREQFFIKKLLATRGRGHPFLSLVKEFWLETNGLIDY